MGVAVIGFSAVFALVFVAGRMFLPSSGWGIAPGGGRSRR
jgi:hypothetical protein